MRMSNNWTTMLSVLVISFACLSLAAPVLRRDAISAKDLISIDPSTASCAGASAMECRTADQAAPNIAAAFANFGIHDFNTQAALVALMLYESGGFKYSVNHYPGVPGQGTRNMQSPAFNTQYLRYLAYVPNSGISPEAVASAIAKGPSATLAHVNDDRWSFASAAWFLKTQCSASIQQGLARGSLTGWNNYLTQCIGTSATSDRTQLLNKVKAVGHWSA